MTHQTKRTLVSVFFAVLVVGAVALASTVTLPNTFTAGTPAVAAQVNANFNAVKTAVDDNHGRITTLEGARQVLFTRWGTSTCPGTSTLVYAGFVAGSNYAQGGSGANTLCLASAPRWTDPSGNLLMFNDTNQDQSLIYGTEYETGNNIIGLGGVNDRDAVCAVCLANGANLMFMYPGSAACPMGWTTQYFGFLMSTAYMQVKTDYICVDSVPTAAGSVADQNGHLLYATEAECGSLPCGAGQYIQNREVTCSVCTR